MQKLLLLFLVVLGCLQMPCLSQAAGAENFGQALAIINKEKYDNPPLALRRIHDLLSQYRRLPDSSLGNAYSELSICFGMMGNMDSAIFFCKKAGPLLTNKIAIVSNFKTLGIIYYKKDQYELARSAFDEALKNCNDIIGSENLKAIVLGEVANLYARQNDYVHSLNTLKQAIEFSTQAPIKDSVTEVILRQKMANSYLMMKEYAFGQQECLKILALLKEMKKEYLLPYTYLSLSETYQYDQNYSGSDSILQLAITIVEKEKKEELVGYALAMMAKNKLKTGHFETGLPLIRSACQKLILAKSPTLLTGANIYLNILEKARAYQEAMGVITNPFINNFLANNYSEDALNFHGSALPFIERAGNLQAVVQRLKIINSTADSVFNKIKLNQILELQAKYQIKTKEQQQTLLLQQNEILNQKNALKNRLLYIWLIIGTAIIIFYFYRSARHKHHLEIKSNELNLKAKEMVWLQQKAATEAEDKKLKEDIIEQQKKELLYSAEKNQELENILQLNNNKNAELFQNEMQAHLHKLKEGRQYLNLFMANYNTLYPNFSNLLFQKFPGITNSDLVFCALLRINLSYKEIAAVLNIEQDSVYKRKYRIMEKMQIESDDDFKRIIFSLS